MRDLIKKEQSDRCKRHSLRSVSPEAKSIVVCCLIPPPLPRVSYNSVVGTFKPATGCHSVISLSGTLGIFQKFPLTTKKYVNNSHPKMLRQIFPLLWSYICNTDLCCPMIERGTVPCPHPCGSWERPGSKSYSPAAPSPNASPPSFRLGV